MARGKTPPQEGEGLNGVCVPQEPSGHGPDALPVSALRHQQAHLDPAAAHGRGPQRPRGGRRRSVLALARSVVQAGTGSDTLSLC